MVELSFPPNNAKVDLPVSFYMRRLPSPLRGCLVGWLSSRGLRPWLRAGVPPGLAVLISSWVWFLPTHRRMVPAGGSLALLVVGESSGDRRPRKYCGSTSASHLRCEVATIRRVSSLCLGSLGSSYASFSTRLCDHAFNGGGGRGDGSAGSALRDGTGWGA